MTVYGLEISNIYLWGVFGSIGVELAAALSIAANNDGVFPAKYHKPLFLTARVVFAFIAGSIPVALDAQNMWSAIWLGASAPLILDKAARGLDPTDKLK